MNRKGDLIEKVTVTKEKKLFFPFYSVTENVTKRDLIVVTCDAHSNNATIPGADISLNVVKVNFA